MGQITGTDADERILDLQKMKIRIIKSLLNMTPVILLAAALMLLYRANMELKYNYESLEWRVKNKTDQLDAVNAKLWRRTLADRPDSSKGIR